MYRITGASAKLKPLFAVQVLNRPPTEAPHALSGMGGMEHGLVDLQMATEAFRDAFSATAPSMEGPGNSDQDYLLAEAFKSSPNPITGAATSDLVLLPLNLCLPACMPIGCMLPLNCAGKVHQAAKLS